MTTILTTISNLFTPQDSNLLEVFEAFPLVTSPSTVFLITASLIISIQLINNYRSIFHSKLFYHHYDTEGINLIFSGCMFGMYGCAVILGSPFINYGGDCFNCSSETFDKLINYDLQKSNDMFEIMSVSFLRFIVFTFFILKIAAFLRPLLIAIDNESRIATNWSRNGIEINNNQNGIEMNRKNEHFTQIGDHVKISFQQLLYLASQVFLVLISVINHPSSVVLAYILIDGILSCATYGYFVLKVLEKNSKITTDGVRKQEFNYDWFKTFLIRTRIISFYFLSIHGLYFLTDSNCGNPVTILIHSVYFLYLGFYSGKKYNENRNQKME